jgi:hypothetical protein
MSETKPIHVKPGLYAWYFDSLKDLAKEYGYNLVLHGSMNRDLDLIALPWEKEVKPHEEMIKAFSDLLGGNIMPQDWRDGQLFEGGEILFTTTHHGRMWYVINLRRNHVDEHGKYVEDQMYYLDISVFPAQQQTQRL